MRNERDWKIDPVTGSACPTSTGGVALIPETEQLVRDFEAREIDVTVPPAGYADRLRDLDGAEVIVGPSRIWEHLAFQFGENNPNEESMNAYLEFRRAVAYLIDREAIAARGFWESEEPLDSILSLHGLPIDSPWE